MHMDVETGRENWEKRRTVMAAPISIEQPRWFVSLCVGEGWGGKGERAYLEMASGR